MSSRFMNADFIRWTDEIVVDMTEFNKKWLENHSEKTINSDDYNNEYEEYLWRWYEREHVFNSFKEAEEYAETVLYNEYVKGQPIYCYYTGNKKAGYQFIMTLTENNKPKGWRLYVL